MLWKWTDFGKGYGHLGVVVYKRGTWGDQRVLKTTPSNPRTIFQTAVRAQFTLNSQAWRGLTQVQRDAWTAAASNFPGVNLMGDTKTPPGNTFYLSVNQNRAILSLTPLTIPPNFSTPSVYDVGAFFVSSSATQTVDFSFTTGGAIAGVESVECFGSPQLSAGISNPGTRFKAIAIIGGPQPNPTPLAGNYIGYYGALVGGLKIFLEMLHILHATGKAGQRQRYSFITT